MKHLLMLFLITGLISCDDSKVYNEFQDPSGNLEWTSDQVLNYDIDIIDKSNKYDLIFGLRYAQGFVYPKLMIEITETSPSGTSISFPYTLQVMDNDGYRGDAAGDIWDLEEVILKNKTYAEVGTYHYRIRHLMKADKIHMVMEVGLILQKVTVPVPQEN